MYTRKIGKSPRCLMFYAVETMNIQVVVLAKSVNFNCHSSSCTNWTSQGDNYTSTVILESIPKVTIVQ